MFQFPWAILSGPYQKRHQFFLSRVMTLFKEIRFHFSMKSMYLVNTTRNITQQNITFSHNLNLIKRNRNTKLNK